MIKIEFLEAIQRLKVPFDFILEAKPSEVLTCIGYQSQKRSYRVWLDGERLGMEINPHISIKPEARVLIEGFNKQ
jgi:hypothetical protein